MTTTIETLRAAITARIGERSIREVGRAAGIEHSVISKFLNGKTDELKLGIIEKLAPALGASLGELFGIEGGTAETVPLDRIDRSDLNPRRRFDETAIAELSASIRSEGLLAPIVVRARGDRFEIVAGERRWRAITLAVTEGALPADHPVPVNVIDVDDATFLVLATLENVQRQDLHPIEEGEAYAALAANGMPTADIARRIGRTQRHVQMRIRMARALADPVKDAFWSGKINVEQARLLAQSDDLELQAGIAGEVERGYLDTEEIAGALMSDLPAIDWAIFDHGLYTGDYLYDEDDEPFAFKDAAQARKLQLEAIEKLPDEAEARGYSEILVKRTGIDDIWSLYRDHPDGTIGLAIVTPDLDVRWMRVQVRPAPREDLALPAQPATALASAAPTRPEEEAATPTAAPWTQAALDHARRRKTRALREAIASDRDAGIRLAVLGLYQPNAEYSPVRLSDRFHSQIYLRVDTTPAEADAHDSFGRDYLGRKGFTYYGDGGTDEALARAWTLIQNDPIEATLDRLARGISERLFDQSEAVLTPGDTAFALAISGTLGLAGNEAAHGLSLEAADLDGLRKSALLLIARELGLDLPDTVRLGDIRTAIENECGVGAEPVLEPRRDYVPPLLRFGTRLEIEAAARGEATPPPAADDIPPEVPKFLRPATSDRIAAEAEDAA